MSSEKAPTRSDDPWRCFAYLTAEKSPLYRAIIERFATAKSEFVLHLRPTEVQSQLQLAGDDVELSEVEAALDQLDEWDPGMTICATLWTTATGTGSKYLDVAALTRTGES